MSEFATIEQAITAIRNGEMVVLLDDESRENEGDVILAASHVTPEAINFMATHARGLVCLAMESDALTKLGIPMMVDRNTSQFDTAFTVTIEAKHGVSTGISAADRARTIRVAVDPASGPNDIVMPGHVFPLRATPGGVLRRPGHTEGAVDLIKFAGLSGAGVLCEVMNEDGSMARRPELLQFAQKHQLRVTTIKALIQYRMLQETIVELAATARLPIRSYGEFTVKVFVDTLNDMEHVALIKGAINPQDEVMVRLHSKCLTGDVFGSNRCDCGAQLDQALDTIATSGGVLLYLNQEGRGIGLSNKIKAYELQDKGYDTVEANKHLGFLADHRDYGIGAQILRALGIQRIKLLTNNPQKVAGIEPYGIDVRREPIEVEANEHNHAYLATKRDKLGHWLSGAPQEHDKNG